MLGRAVIGLEPAEFEMRRRLDLAGEGKRRLARLDAAAVAAHVDLDMDRQVDPGLAGGGLESRDLRRVVGADADPRVRAEPHQPAQLLAADDLVGDEHVA